MDAKKDFKLISQEKKKKLELHMGHSVFGPGTKEERMDTGKNSFVYRETRYQSQFKSLGLNDLCKVEDEASC